MRLAPSRPCIHTKASAHLHFHISSYAKRQENQLAIGLFALLLLPNISVLALNQERLTTDSRLLVFPHASSSNAWQPASPSALLINWRA